MKLYYRNLIGSLLAGAAGLWLAGNATAANTPTSPSTVPPCCRAAANCPTAAAAKTSAKPDRLTTCPVSKQKLGEMTDPYVFTYKGQEVKLCCKSCLKKFKQNPEKYLKIIRAADKK